MATSPKFGIALLATAAAMAYGVPAAHAALGDLVEPVTSTVEETVADTTSTAQETTEAVGETADQAATATPVADTVDTATSTVDQSVAVAATAVRETTTTVGNTVNQAAATVDQATKAATGELPVSVPNLVDDATKRVATTAGAEAKEPSSPAAGTADRGSVSGPGSSTTETGGGTASAGAPPVATPAANVPQTSNGSGVPTVPLHRGVGFGSRISWPLSAGTQGASGTGPNQSDGKRRIPVPLLPLSIPAGGAPAGAAGAALLALLLGAFVLATPRTGRRLRPGPSLGWSPPFLSRQERPG